MYNGTSLFSNVGIDEHFFKTRNVKIKVANELLDKRAMFYKHLYPDVDVIIGDIRNDIVFKTIINKHVKYKCDFLIATPPCQGMSVAGKMDKNDERNALIKYVVKFIQITKPKNILIENVPGLLKFKIEVNGEKVAIKDYIINTLECMGYIVNYGVLDAADYETPQHRKRAIFLISNIRKWEFPKPKNRITVKDVIYNLESIESGEKGKHRFHYAKKHNKKHILWMSNTPTGKSAHDNLEHFPIKDNGEKIKGYKTTYKRIDWDKPAPTITMANGSISSQNNVHPGRIKKDKTYSDARVLTILELLRLTGLPDDWNIPIWATDNLIREVIGESFPPKFALSMLSTMPNEYEDE
ncbi:DNA (cytosine-5)-methyltransferase 1 [Spiroplasma gladiatoris]|uniref:DNA (cytosine-5-)-methyltransferase n=1 Tax=Spiroplasma gladiatoris TaxID=2143 RepID=A0A4P7AHL2_9MOLU|nr:DNA cytosine methyltransferase [Spiroplasma gladiatoris]QBQ07611.1 DNA (cytosine-5)-methyltransferase 1 [Spiroplasma gladiatoris]